MKGNPLIFTRQIRAKRGRIEKSSSHNGERTPPACSGGRLVRRNLRESSRFARPASRLRSPNGLMRWLVEPVLRRGGLRWQIAPADSRIPAMTNARAERASDKADAVR